jgi:hypothetical protein
VPVTVPITVADPPAAPAGYTLVAFEVRTYAAGSAEMAALTTDGGNRQRHGLRIEPIAVFAGTTSGFEDAAKILVQAVRLSLREVGVGLRLAAVAWWVDTPLTDCVGGRERQVSVYDAGEDVWGEWVPEERTGPRLNPAAPRDTASRGQKAAAGKAK